RQAVRRDSRARILFQEAGAVDQRDIKIAAIEFGRENLVEPPDVAVLHRSDIVGVERGEGGEVGVVFVHAAAPRRALPVHSAYHSLLSSGGNSLTARHGRAT